MNLKKTLSSAATLFATTSLLAVSSFALQTALTAPTFTPSVTPVAGGSAVVGYVLPTTVGGTVTITVSATGGTNPSDTLCFYTTNGDTPTSANTPCSTPFTFNNNADGTAASFTIKAIALPGSNDVNTYKASLVSSAKFLAESKVSNPVVTPKSATGDVNVQISDAWLSSTGGKPSIHYTTDGTTPTALHGNLYLPGITKLEIGSTAVQLQVVAYALNYAPSDVFSGSFGPVSSGLQYFVGAGSSAQYDEFAFAMGGPLGNGLQGDGVTPSICGGHHFTKKNAAQVADTRSALTPADTGHLLLVWDDDNNPTKICAYVNLDSTLGVKAFMVSNLAAPASYINITGTTSPDNMISPFWLKGSANADEASIPSAVLTAIQGQNFNAGITDIRPEDAKFATTRALTTLNTAIVGATVKGLGYGPGPIGSQVVETITPWNASGTASKFNVVDFALSGTDPISRSAQNPYTTITVGAAPVVVFVNTYASTADSKFHLGDPSVTNVGRFTLAGIFNGTITRTSALAPSTTAAAGAPLQVWQREPLSGTYNTFEYNIPASKEIGTTQENGVLPSVVAADANGNTGNPLNITVTSGATSTLGVLNSSGQMIGMTGSRRARAIGTGDMVKAVSYTTGCTITETAGTGSASGTCVGADNIGYAFWGYGNFSFGNNNAPLTTKYLQVDGVDPINSSYNGGTFPVCDKTNFTAPGQCTTVPFTHILDGSYPIWSIYRVVTKSPAPALVSALVAGAQTNYNVVYDFVPANQLGVFRSHYTQAGVLPHNGNVTGVAEAGGDVGGAVFTVSNDLDHVTDYGTSTASGEILNVKQ
jgi:hypothetical protein